MRRSEHQSEAPDRAGDSSKMTDRRIGETIDGRFRIEEKIGEGAMGSVYIAEQLTLHKPVALKIIHPDIAGNGDMRARFAREAMATAQIDHPNVVSALDFGSLEDGCAYLVMPLVRGPSLADVMEASAIPVARMCSIGAQIADALYSAHTQGVVHRDLKPENVILSTRDDGTEVVKVLDFGIARVQRSTKKAPVDAAAHRTLTRVGMVIGTPGYMAPEQAMGGTIDHRVDLYALGVILWEGISGRFLFEEEELTAIVERQLREPPPHLSTVAPDQAVPESLDLLVASLLDSRPEARPAEAASVRDALVTLSGRGASASSIAIPQPKKVDRDSATAELATSRPARAIVDPTIEAPPPPEALGTIPEAESDTLMDEGSRRDAEERPRRMRKLRAAAAVVVVLCAGFAYLALGSRGWVPLPGKSHVDVDPGVASTISVLLHSTEDAVREEAAQSLLEHRPLRAVPEHALAVAELELASGCREKTEALARVRRLGNREALPYVARMRELPRRGCGPRRSRDCYGCLRAPIEATYLELGGEAVVAEQ